jgi:hypothetical protein
VGHVRLRWLGHQLHAECEIVSRRTLLRLKDIRWPSRQSELLHVLPRLSAALVHADLQADKDIDYQAELASHR